MSFSFNLDELLDEIEAEEHLIPVYPDPELTSIVDLLIFGDEPSEDFLQYEKINKIISTYIPFGSNKEIITDNRNVLLVGCGMNKSLAVQILEKMNEKVELTTLDQSLASVDFLQSIMEEYKTKENQIKIWKCLQGDLANVEQLEKGKFDVILITDVGLAEAIKSRCTMQKEKLQEIPNLYSNVAKLFKNSETNGASNNSLSVPKFILISQRRRPSLITRQNMQWDIESSKILKANVSMDSLSPQKKYLYVHVCHSKPSKIFTSNEKQTALFHTYRYVLAKASEKVLNYLPDICKEHLKSVETKNSALASTEIICAACETFRTSLEASVEKSVYSVPDELFHDTRQFKLPELLTVRQLIEKYENLAATLSPDHYLNVENHSVALFCQVIGRNSVSKNVVFYEIVDPLEPNTLPLLTTWADKKSLNTLAVQLWKHAKTDVLDDSLIDKISNPTVDLNFMDDTRLSKKYEKKNRNREMKSLLAAASEEKHLAFKLAGLELSGVTFSSQDTVNKVINDVPKISAVCESWPPEVCSKFSYRDTQKIETNSSLPSNFPSMMVPGVPSEIFRYMASIRPNDIALCIAVPGKSKGGQFSVRVQRIFLLHSNLLPRFVNPT